ncbi:hypothetical protein LguiA_019197 [Lonicera macranthoides]
MIVPLSFTATLAIGSSAKKSLVQCNVGDKSPVLLCALLPDRTESCQLDLEFEEADEVVFSVIGPRSVHLTGYYVSNSRNLKLDDDSESFGEDIANTDTEEGNRSSDDDEYEDSFINDDDDPNILSPSPVSSDRVDEVVDIKKPRDNKIIHKRLKRKYQTVDSDEEISSGQQNDINGSRAIQESESEDGNPISSIFNNKAVAKNMTEENANKKKIAENGDKTVEDDGTRAKKEENGTHVIESKGKVDALVIDNEPKSKEDRQCNSLPLSDEVGPENRTKQKKKKKEQDTETATNSRGSDPPHNSLMTPAKIAPPENGVKAKKKRKERFKEEKNLIADSEEVSENSPKSKKRRKGAREGKSHEDNSTNLIKEDQSKQDEVKADGNMNVRNEQDKKPPSSNTCPECSHENDPVFKVVFRLCLLICLLKYFLHPQSMVHVFTSFDNARMLSQIHNQWSSKFVSYREIWSIDIDSDRLEESEKKSKKKRKKKSKILENDENVKVEVPLSPKEEMFRSKKESKDNNVDTMSSQARTLSNGLIIEDLELGKSNGKMAAPGRKASDKEIIEGWNLGLDGMRAGDKRRLVIPPTLGYGSQGTGENIPPNSWLVYDIELVSVH